MGRRQGKRVGGSAYWRIGVCGSKTAFRHGYNDQEVSAELTMFFANADTPIRRYADTFPLAGPFSSQPSGPGPVGCFSALLALDPYDSDMGALTPVRLGPP